mmetsp:Transcript_54384/g.96434  ORF Transcript_54384/g.96434 Transcript_54384/m.96434 type:complete len:829 (+) Transcript_54384:2-2488(+)
MAKPGRIVRFVDGAESDEEEAPKPDEKQLPGRVLRFADDSTEESQTPAAPKSVRFESQKVQSQQASHASRQSQKARHGQVQDSSDAKVEELFDSGDPPFTTLLQQLAQLHRSRLRELWTYRAEKICQSQDYSLIRSETARQSVMTFAKTASIASSVGPCSDSPQDGALCASNGFEPLPPTEPVRMLGDLRESANSTGRREDVEVKFSEDAETRRTAFRGACKTKIQRSAIAGDLLSGVFELQNSWKHHGKFNKHEMIHQFSLGLLRQSSSTHAAYSDDESGNVSAYNGILARLIVFPASPKRLVWDLIGGVLILWDLMIIPLSLSALTPDKSTFLDFMDWLTLTFWTANMFASLLVGYVNNGITEMNPMRILVNYLKTWFILDLLVVLPDWIFTIANMTSDAPEEGESDGFKLLRILRIVRCMRLLRLAKLKTILSTIIDLINSEYTSIIVNLIKMIVTLVVVNHFLGCTWFMLADANNSGDATWVAEQNFDDVSPVYQYVTSFHWAITQFTPASMSVQPQNLLERTYAVTLVIGGLVGFSYLVGSITGSLAELRNMNSDTAKQFWNLRRYLNQNKVPRELSVRIQKYLEHQWQSLKVAVSRETVLVLKYLSEQLNNELQCAIAVPHMVVHPLFQRLNSASNVTMQRLATSAISRKHLASGDSLFFAFDEATNMSFVCGGTLQYIRMSHEVPAEWVEKGEDWISEPVLWMEVWHHRGELVAVVPCDILLIDAREFRSTCKKSPQVHAFVSSYAASFVKWINGIDGESLSDISQCVSLKHKILELMPDHNDDKHRLNRGTRRASPFGSSKRFGGNLRSMFRRDNVKNFD